MAEISNEKILSAITDFKNTVENISNSEINQKVNIDLSIDTTDAENSISRVNQMYIDLDRNGRNVTPLDIRDTFNVDVSASDINNVSPADTQKLWNSQYDQLLALSKVLNTNPKAIGMISSLNNKELGRLKLFVSDDNYASSIIDGYKQQYLNRGEMYDKKDIDASLKKIYGDNYGQHVHGMQYSNEGIISSSNKNDTTLGHEYGHIIFENLLHKYVKDPNEAKLYAKRGWTEFKKYLESNLKKNINKESYNEFINLLENINNHTSITSNDAYSNNVNEIFARTFADYLTIFRRNTMDKFEFSKFNIYKYTGNKEGGFPTLEKNELYKVFSEFFTKYGIDESSVNKNLTVDMIESISRNINKQRLSNADIIKNLSSIQTLEHYKEFIKLYSDNGHYAFTTDEAKRINDTILPQLALRLYGGDVNDISSMERITKSLILEFKNNMSLFDENFEKKVLFSSVLSNIKTKLKSKYVDKHGIYKEIDDNILSYIRNNGYGDFSKETLDDLNTIFDMSKQYLTQEESINIKKFQTTLSAERIKRNNDSASKNITDSLKSINLSAFETAIKSLSDTFKTEFTVAVSKVANEFKNSFEVAIRSYSGVVSNNNRPTITKMVKSMFGINSPMIVGANNTGNNNTGNNNNGNGGSGVQTQLGDFKEAIRLGVAPGSTINGRTHVAIKNYQQLLDEGDVKEMVRSLDVLTKAIKQLNSARDTAWYRLAEGNKNYTSLELKNKNYSGMANSIMESYGYVQNNGRWNKNILTDGYLRNTFRGADGEFYEYNDFFKPLKDGGDQIIVDLMKRLKTNATIVNNAHENRLAPSETIDYIREMRDIDKQIKSRITHLISQKRADISEEVKFDNVLKSFEELGDMTRKVNGRIISYRDLDVRGITNHKRGTDPKYSYEGTLKEMKNATSLEERIRLRDEFELNANKEINRMNDMYGFNKIYQSFIKYGNKTEKIGGVDTQYSTFGNYAKTLGELDSIMFELSKLSSESIHGTISDRLMQKYAQYNPDSKETRKELYSRIMEDLINNYKKESLDSLKLTQTYDKEIAKLQKMYNVFQHAGDQIVYDEYGQGRRRRDIDPTAFNDIAVAIENAINAHINTRNTHPSYRAVDAYGRTQFDIDYLGLQDRISGYDSTFETDVKNEAHKTKLLESLNNKIIKLEAYGNERVTLNGVDVLRRDIVDANGNNMYQQAMNSLRQTYNNAQNMSWTQLSASGANGFSVAKNDALSMDNTITVFKRNLNTFVDDANKFTNEQHKLQQAYDDIVAYINAPSKNGNTFVDRRGDIEVAGRRIYEDYANTMNGVLQNALSMDFGTLNTVVNPNTGETNFDVAYRQLTDGFTSFKSDAKTLLEAANKYDNDINKYEEAVNKFRAYGDESVMRNGNRVARNTLPEYANVLTELENRLQVMRGMTIGALYATDANGRTYMENQFIESRSLMKGFNTNAVDQLYYDNKSFDTISDIQELTRSFIEYGNKTEKVGDSTLEIRNILSNTGINIHANTLNTLAMLLQQARTAASADEVGFNTKNPTTGLSHADRLNEQVANTINTAKNEINTIIRNTNRGESDLNKFENQVRDITEYLNTQITIGDRKIRVSELNLDGQSIQDRLNEINDTLQRANNLGAQSIGDLNNVLNLQSGDINLEDYFTQLLHNQIQNLKNAINLEKSKQIDIDKVTTQYEKLGLDGQDIRRFGHFNIRTDNLRFANDVNNLTGATITETFQHRINDSLYALNHLTVDELNEVNPQTGVTRRNRIMADVENAMNEYKQAIEDATVAYRQQGQLGMELARGLAQTEREFDSLSHNITMNQLFRDSEDPLLHSNFRIDLTRFNAATNAQYEDFRNRRTNIHNRYDDAIANGRIDLVEGLNQEHIDLNREFAEFLNRNIAPHYRAMEERRQNVERTMNDVNRLQASLGYGFLKMPNDLNYENLVHGNAMERMGEYYKFLNLPSVRESLNGLMQNVNKTLNGIVGGISSAISKVSTIIKTFIGTLAGIGVSITAFGATITALGKTIITNTDEYRKQTIALTGVYKSTGKTQSMINMAYDITKGMPINYTQTIQTLSEMSAIPAVQTVLKSSDTNKSQTLMNKMFKVITAMTTMRPDQKASDAIFSLRNAFAGDLRSLQRRFDLPTNAIMNTKGTIGLAKVKNDPTAMLNSLENYFDTFLDVETINKVSDTVSIIIEKIKGAIDLFKANIGNSGFYDLVARDLRKIREYVTNFVTSADGKTIAIRISDAFSNAYNSVKSIANKIKNVINEIFNINIGNLPELFASGLEFLSKAVKYVDKLINVKSLVDVIKNAFGIIDGKETVIASIFNKIVSGLKIVADVGLTVLKNVLSVTGSIIDLMKQSGIGTKGLIYMWLFGPGNILNAISGAIGAISSGFVLILSSINAAIAGFNLLHTTLHLTAATAATTIGAIPVLLLSAGTALEVLMTGFDKFGENVDDVFESIGILIDKLIYRISDVLQDSWGDAIKENIISKYVDESQFKNLDYIEASDKNKLLGQIYDNKYTNSLGLKSDIIKILMDNILSMANENDFDVLDGSHADAFSRLIKNYLNTNGNNNPNEMSIASLVYDLTTYTHELNQTLTERKQEDFKNSVENSNINPQAMFTERLLTVTKRMSGRGGILGPTANILASLFSTIEKMNGNSGNPDELNSITDIISDIENRMNKWNKNIESFGNDNENNSYWDKLLDIVSGIKAEIDGIQLDRIGPDADKPNYVKEYNEISENIRKTDFQRSGIFNKSFNTDASEKMFKSDYGNFGPAGINDLQVGYVEAVAKKKEITDRYVESIKKGELNGFDVINTNFAIMRLDEEIQSYRKMINENIEKSVELIENALSVADYSYIQTDVDKFVKTKNSEFKNKLFAETRAIITMRHSAYFSVTNDINQFIQNAMKETKGNIDEFISGVETGRFSELMKNIEGSGKEIVTELVNVYKSQQGYLENLINERNIIEGTKKVISTLTIPQLNASWGEYMTSSSRSIRNTAGNQYMSLIEEGIETDRIINMIRNVRDIAIESIDDINTSIINATKNVTTGIYNSLKTGFDKMLGRGDERIKSRTKIESAPKYTVDSTGKLVEIKNTNEPEQYKTEYYGINDIGDEISNTIRKEVVGVFTAQSAKRMTEMIMGSTQSGKTGLIGSILGVFGINPSDIVDETKEMLSPDTKALVEASKNDADNIANSIFDSFDKITNPINDIVSSVNSIDSKITSKNTVSEDGLYHGRVYAKEKYGSDLEPFNDVDFAETVTLDMPLTKQALVHINPLDVFYDDSDLPATGKLNKRQYVDSAIKSTNNPTKDYIMINEELSDIVNDGITLYDENKITGLYDALKSTYSSISSTTSNFIEELQTWYEISKHINPNNFNIRNNDYSNGIPNNSYSVFELSKDIKDNNNDLFKSNIEPVISGIINTKPTITVEEFDKKIYDRFNNIFKDNNNLFKSNTEPVLSSISKDNNNLFKSHTEPVLSTISKDIKEIVDNKSSGIQRNDFQNPDITSSVNIGDASTNIAAPTINNIVAGVSTPNTGNTFANTVSSIGSVLSGFGGFSGGSSVGNNAVGNLLNLGIGSFANSIGSNNMNIATNAMSSALGLGGGTLGIFNTGKTSASRKLANGSNALTGLMTLASAGTSGTSLALNSISLLGGLTSKNAGNGMINSSLTKLFGDIAVGGNGGTGLLGGLSRYLGGAVTENTSALGVVAGSISKALFGGSGANVASLFSGAAVPVIGAAVSLLSQDGWGWGARKDKYSNAKASAQNFNSMKTAMTDNRRAMAQSFYMADSNILSEIENFQFGNINYREWKSGKWYKGNKSRKGATDATDFVNTLEDYWDLILEAAESQYDTQRKLTQLQKTNYMEYLQETNKYENMKLDYSLEELNKWKREADKWKGEHGNEDSFTVTVFTGESMTIADLNNKVMGLTDSYIQQKDAVEQNIESMRQEKLATEDARLDYILALDNGKTPLLSQQIEKQKLMNEWNSIVQPDGSIGYKNGTKEWFQWQTRYENATNSLTDAIENLTKEIANTWISDMTNHLQSYNRNYDNDTLEKASAMYKNINDTKNANALTESNLTEGYTSFLSATGNFDKNLITKDISLGNNLKKAKVTGYGVAEGSVTNLYNTLTELNKLGVEINPNDYIDTTKGTYAMLTGKTTLASEKNTGTIRLGNSAENMYSANKDALKYLYTADGITTSLIGTTITKAGEIKAKGWIFGDNIATQWVDPNTGATTINGKKAMISIAEYNKLSKSDRKLYDRWPSTYGTDYYYHKNAVRHGAYNTGDTYTASYGVNYDYKVDDMSLKEGADFVKLAEILKENKDKITEYAVEQLKNEENAYKLMLVNTKVSNNMKEYKDTINNILTNQDENVIDGITNHLDSLKSAFTHSATLINANDYSGYEEFQDSIVTPIVNDIFSQMTNISETVGTMFDSGILSVNDELAKTLNNRLTSFAGSFERYQILMNDIQDDGKLNAEGSLDTYKQLLKDANKNMSDKDIENLAKNNIAALDASGIAGWVTSLNDLFGGIYEYALNNSETSINNLYEQAKQMLYTKNAQDSILSSISGFDDFAIANDAAKMFTDALGTDALTKLIGLEGNTFDISSISGMTGLSLGSNADPYEMYYEYEKDRIMKRIHNEQEGSEEWYQAELDMWNLMQNNAEHLKQKADEATNAIEDALDRIEETVKTRVAEEAKSGKGDIIFMDLGDIRGKSSSAIDQIMKHIDLNTPEGQKLVKRLGQLGLSNKR